MVTWKGRVPRTPAVSQAPKVAQTPIDTVSPRNKLPGELPAETRIFPPRQPAHALEPVSSPVRLRNSVADVPQLPRVNHAAIARVPVSGYSPRAVPGSVVAVSNMSSALESHELSPISLSSQASALRSLQSEAQTTLIETQPTSSLAAVAITPVTRPPMPVVQVPMRVSNADRVSPKPSSRKTPIVQPKAIVEATTEVTVEETVDRPSQEIMEPSTTPEDGHDELQKIDVFEDNRISLNTESSVDDSDPTLFSQPIEVMKRRYIVGKRVSRDILDRHEQLIISKGDIVTVDVLRRAELSGKLVELILRLDSNT